MATYQLKMCIKFVASGGFPPNLPRLKLPFKRDEWIRVLHEICLDSVITMLESTDVSQKTHGEIRLETIIQ